MTTGKTLALTRQTFVGKVMSLLLNMLSRLVITFLPRSKRLLISWLQSPSAVILEPPKIKSDTVSTVSPSICHEWWDRMPWSSFSERWALIQLFHSPLSLSSLIIRKMQIKTTIRYHLTLGKMDSITEQSTNSECLRECGEKRNFLHCWWECKLVQQL